MPVERSVELGLPPGTGKDYSLTDLEDLTTPPFEAELFGQGTLEFDQPYIDTLARTFINRWQPYEGKLKDSQLWRDAAVNDRQRYEIFTQNINDFKGKIPASWRETDAIVESLRRAGGEGVQLRTDLVNFSVIHPSHKVRTAVWENQTLTPDQMVIAAHLGIWSSDPEQTMNAKKLAWVTQLDLPIALNNVFGNIDLDKAYEGAPTIDETKPKTFQGEISEPFDGKLPNGEPTLFMLGTTVDGNAKIFGKVADWELDLHTKKGYNFAIGYIAYAKQSLGIDVRLGYASVRDRDRVRRGKRVISKTVGVYAEEPSMQEMLDKMEEKPWMVGGDGAPEGEAMDQYVQLLVQAMHMLPPREVLGIKK